MQTQHQPDLPQSATPCRRQPRAVLVTVIGIGTFLSAASAGQPVPANPGKEVPQADAGQSPAAATADRPPAAPDDQLAPADPLLIPELPPPPHPLSDAGQAMRQGGAVTLRDEVEEDTEIAPADPSPANTTGTFVVPGFYGSAPKQFTLGQGRLGALPLQTVLTLGIGYDDNIRATTSGAGAEKVASAFTTARIATSYHTAGLMQVFVFDGSAGTDIYWGQEDPDYDLALGMSYQRRFVSPATVTANASLSYRTQPDYAQVNLVRGASETEDEDASGVLSASAKVDLRYAWTAQFSTLTSFAADTILYGGSRSDADSIDLTFGNELRYRVDRYTWIGETRYQFNARPNDEELESNTLFLLLGAEWHLGPWLQVSSRLGGTIRSYQDGGNTTSPHGELAVTFAPNVQNSFSLNARYGLERTALDSGDSKTFRVGASYTRVFSTRMSGTLALSYLRSEESASGRDSEEFAEGGERIFDATASLNYRLTNRLGLSASITCTRGDAADGLADPDRNRFVLNATYQF